MGMRVRTIELGCWCRRSTIASLNRLWCCVSFSLRRCCACRSEFRHRCTAARLFNSPLRLIATLRISTGAPVYPSICAATSSVCAVAGGAASAVLEIHVARFDQSRLRCCCCDRGCSGLRACAARRRRRGQRARRQIVASEQGPPGCCLQFGCCEIAKLSRNGLSRFCNGLSRRLLPRRHVRAPRMLGPGTRVERGRLFARGLRTTSSADAVRQPSSLL